ncbi:MAG: Gfo/Idh/MocA family oxidoreductase [Bacteroidota bacterium]
MPDFYINRRQFLYSASASLALSMLGANGLDIIFSEKPRKVGLIGSGWYGKNDVFRLIQVANVEITAICDVDQKHLFEAATLISQRQKTGKKPRTYKDYRELLAKEPLDIVVIGTPDHWHTLPAIAAMEAGAHVYLQKPTSVDMLESEAILAAARKHQRVVQVGTQRRSTPHLMEAKQKIIDSGMIGAVGHAEICCYYNMRGNGFYKKQAIPDHLDYDFWTGPAPMRSYDGLPHGRWRQFKEYGNGIVGDMCVHMLDSVRWMLNLGRPKSVRSTGGIYVQKEVSANIPDTQNALFEFDELTVVWQHRTWGQAADSEYPWSFILYGENGTLKADVRKYEYIPKDKKKQSIKGIFLNEDKLYPEEADEKRIERHAAPATRRHMLDFLAAIDKKTRPVADIEQGHISTQACIMANLSLELNGRKLIYDHQKQRFVKDKAANKLLARNYRGDWERPKA